VGDGGKGGGGERGRKSSGADLLRCAPRCLLDQAWNLQLVCLVSLLGFRVWVWGFRVYGSWFMVEGLGFRVEGFWCRVSGLGFRV
jgi:hypothetical protein